MTGALLERMLGVDLHRAAEIARVCGVARQIVTQPATRYGYVDVGDVLVRYLQGSMTEEAAIARMRDFEADYANARAGR